MPSLDLDVCFVLYVVSDFPLAELWILISACGGDPNVLTTASNSTLYHLVMAHPDPNMDLVMKLCEAGTVCLHVIVCLA